MGAWERLRKWLACWIWPEFKEEIEQLTARLATTHQRMREMYWDEKAKELAKARIAGLEDSLDRACISLHLQGETIGAARYMAEADLPWSAERAEKWRTAPEPFFDWICPAEGPVVDGLEARGISEEKPEVIEMEAVAKAEGHSEAKCVFHGMDPLGFCRTHSRQCLTPEMFMRIKAQGVLK
jgi:hypothetical protein